MKRSRAAGILLAAVMVMTTGCGSEKLTWAEEGQSHGRQEGESDVETVIEPTSGIQELEAGFLMTRYDGDYGFDLFLGQGGAATDREVMGFLTSALLGGADMEFEGQPFGCSTAAGVNPEGERLFGRNFDWNTCEALVMEAHPENGYASISTVNMDFIRQGAGGIGQLFLNDEARRIGALYAPLDGMNEKGLAVAVNMIQDSAVISQDRGKPDLTTTTAVRLLLDKAASVEEGLELLERYDLHGSMGMMVHFALADRSGRSVAVEYIGNEMRVIDTPVVTNFYLAEGEKQGIGTAQSHERYEILMRRLGESEGLTMEDMRDALDSVSKDNFGEFESTEWSIVFNQTAGEVRYYHREDYEKPFVFGLEMETE